MTAPAQLPLYDTLALAASAPFVVPLAEVTEAESTSWLGCDWWSNPPPSRRASLAAKRSRLEGMARAAVARRTWQKRAAANTMMAVCKGDEGKVDLN